MSDSPSDALRHHAFLMKAPQHGWVIIPFIQALLDRSIQPEGQLYGSRDCFAVKDYAVSMANRYFDNLKPRGGSWAGATKGQNNEPDPTGDSNLTTVLTGRRACPRRRGRWLTTLRAYYS